MICPIHLKNSLPIHKLSVRPIVEKRNITKSQRGKEHSLINKMKANWIGHILHRNCLLQLVIERKRNETRGRGRRRKQILDDLEEKRRYWKLRKRTGSYCLENSLWTTLGTCRKTDYVMMRIMIMMMIL